MNQLQPWLQSSTDPTQVSNTVRGIILGLSSFIIAIAATQFHIVLTADSILTFATDIGMAAGGIWGIYGLFMKGAMKVGSVRSGAVS